MRLPDVISYASYYGTDTNKDITITEHMEGIITRNDQISGYTAQQILDLVLNKAHGDTAYTATKLSDPLRIGLPSDIVLFIPWQGVSGTNLGSSQPSKNILSTLEDLAINVVVTGVKLAVGGLIAIGNFLVHLGEAIVSWGISLVANAIGAATAVVKAAVSVAILVLAELIKAIILIGLDIMFVSLNLLFGSFNKDIVNINSANHSISIHTSSVNVELSINIFNVLNGLFNLYLPVVQIDFSKGNNNAGSIVISLPIINLWDSSMTLNPSTESNLNKQSNNKVTGILSLSKLNINTNYDSKYFFPKQLLVIFKNK